MGVTIKRVCFDIETEPFTDEFRRADTLTMRVRHAPKMRVACVFDESTHRYQFFSPRQARALITVLLNADEVLSYNGKRFDLLVLRRHHRLNVKLHDRINRTHVDLCEDIRRDFGRRYKLDALTRMNLNERKSVDGRYMAALDLHDLKQACKSDVRQTYLLWKLFVENNLKVPTTERRDYNDIPLIGHHVSSPFPLAELDTSEMTEGQEAEYLAGTWAVDIYGGLWEMGGSRADRTGISGQPVRTPNILNLRRPQLSRLNH